MADTASAMTDTASAIATNTPKFGGICWDEKISDWTMCYEFEQDGDIGSEDSDYVKACEPHTSQLAIDWRQALRIIGESSQAVASLHLTDCKLTKMSGFFLNDNYFLTCAHFNPLNDTEKKMHEPNSKFARASVGRNPQPKNTDGPWLHLVHYDSIRDLALFRINTIQDEGTRYPKSTIEFNSLVAAKDMNFMSNFEDRRVFTIGYNQHGSDNENIYRTMYREVVNQLDSSLKPKKASQLRKRLRGYAVAPPEFSEVFLPGKKTLSIGSLIEEYHDGVHWSHRISGWYGISGALIACMDNEKELKMAIIGLFTKGIRQSPDNGMRPFTKQDLTTIAEKLGVSCSSL